MAETRSPRSAGFTIIEMVGAIAVFTGILVGVGTMLRSTTQATDYLTGSSEMDAALQRVLSDLTADLKCASISRTMIDTADPDHDSVSIQVPDPLATTSPDFGYVDTNGTFWADWSCLYFINGDELTRRILDNNGLVVSDQALCGYVDTAWDDGGGLEKGFRITEVDDLITVEVRLYEAAASGDQRRSIVTTVMQVTP